MNHVSPRHSDKKNFKSAQKKSKDTKMKKNESCIYV